MPKAPLVAVDTNFPLLLAKGLDEAQDALIVLRERVRPAAILVPPTALEELVYQSESECDPAQRQLARIALEHLRTGSEFRFAPLTSTQEAIVSQAAQRILMAGLLPVQERNDAAIVAESAVLNSILLVSNDSHLLGVDHRGLGLLFRELDLPVPLIVSPREIVRKFYR